MTHQWSIVVALHHPFSYPLWYVDQSFEKQHPVLELERWVFFWRFFYCLCKRVVWSSLLDFLDQVIVGDTRSGCDLVDLKGPVGIFNHHLHARFLFSLHVVFAAAHCVGARVFRTFPVVNLEFERSEVLVPSR